MNKNVFIVIRVTPDEKRILVRRAKRAGQNMSVFLRNYLKL